MNNLLLPNSLCGPAGWRNYSHLFPFKTLFFSSLSLFCSSSSVNEVDTQSLVALLRFFFCPCPFPRWLHMCVCLLSRGRCNPNKGTGMLRWPVSAWPTAERRRGTTWCTTCQMIVQSAWINACWVMIALVHSSPAHRADPLIQNNHFNTGVVSRWSGPEKQMLTTSFTFNSFIPEVILLSVSGFDFWKNTRFVFVFWNHAGPFLIKHNNAQWESRRCQQQWAGSSVTNGLIMAAH